MKSRKKWIQGEFAKLKVNLSWIREKDSEFIVIDSGFKVNKVFRNDYEFTIYFANSQWIHYSLFVSQIDFESTIFYIFFISRIHFNFTIFLSNELPFSAKLFA